MGMWRNRVLIVGDSRSIDLVRIEARFVNSTV